MSVVINDGDGKNHRISKNSKFLFFLYLRKKSYDKLDDFDHQASSEQEKESLKKLIQV